MNTYMKSAIATAAVICKTKDQFLRVVGRSTGLSGAAVLENEMVLYCLAGEKFSDKGRA